MTDGGAAGALVAAVGSVTGNAGCATDHAIAPKIRRQMWLVAATDQVIPPKIRRPMLLVAATPAPLASAIFAGAKDSPLVNGPGEACAVEQMCRFSSWATLRPPPLVAPPRPPPRLLPPVWPLLLPSPKPTAGPTVWRLPLRRLPPLWLLCLRVWLRWLPPLWRLRRLPPLRPRVLGD